MNADVRNAFAWFSRLVGERNGLSAQRIDEILVFEEEISSFPTITVKKDRGCWVAYADGKAQIARDTRRFTRTKVREEAIAYVRMHAKVDVVAKLYMCGDLERIPALAMVERIPGVRDVFEARYLLDAACAR